MADSVLDSVTPDSPPVSDPDQVATRPYLGSGEFQPEGILQSPDASLGEKASAVEQLAQQQSALQQRQLATKAKAFNAWQTANQNYDKLEQISQSNPGKVELPERPDPSRFGLDTGDIAALSNPQTQQQAAPAVAQQDKEDQQSLFQRQQDQAAALGQKNAALQSNMLQGYMAQQNKISQHQQDLMDESIKTIDDKQFQLDKIDPNKFWNNLSGGQKVLGTLAIALGEVGKSLTGQNSNTALDMINKQIDRDIEAQKWTNDQKIQMKQNALKRIGLEIEKYSALSHDQDRKMQMGVMVQQINQQQEMMRQQMAMKMAVAKAANGGGLAPQDAEVLLDEGQKKRAVTLPNGNVAVAPVELDVEQRKLLTDKANGMQLINQYRDMVNNTPLSEKLNPASAANQKISTMRSAIGGLMHTDLVGPGPYTEQKQKKVDEILGNAFMTIPSRFNARMDGLKGLLNTTLKGTYKSIGVSLPQTPADTARLKLQKMGYSPEAIDKAIRQQGQTDPRFRE